MTNEQARAILHMSAVQATDEKSIKSAFNLAMIGAHPDTSPIGSAEKVKLVKEARDHLLRFQIHGEKPCILCGGRGYIVGMKCAPCEREGRV
jgi:DnaJ-class molecular chaperone